jgi:hypothetical protein
MPPVDILGILFPVTALAVPHTTSATPSWRVTSPTASLHRISKLEVNAESGWDNLNQKINQLKDDKHLLHPSVQEKSEKFITYGRSAYIFR